MFHVCHTNSSSLGRQSRRLLVAALNLLAASCTKQAVHHIWDKTRALVSKLKMCSQNSENHQMWDLPPPMKHKKTRRFINDCTEKDIHHLFFFIFSTQQLTIQNIRQQTCFRTCTGHSLWTFLEHYFFPFLCFPFPSTDILPQCMRTCRQITVGTKHRAAEGMEGFSCKEPLQVCLTCVHVTNLLVYGERQGMEMHTHLLCF
jgi:hypothetical protein